MAFALLVLRWISRGLILVLRPVPRGPDLSAALGARVRAPCGLPGVASRVAATHMRGACLFYADIANKQRSVGYDFIAHGHTLSQGERASLPM